MNLCGGGADQQFSSSLCGTCAEEEDANAYLSSIVLSGDDASLIEAKAPESEQQKTSNRTGWLGHHSSYSRFRVPSQRDLLHSPRSYGASMSNLTINCSPSPLLLNPLSDDWENKYQSAHKSTRRSGGNDSRMDDSSTMNKMMHKLEEGFRLVLLEEGRRVSEVFLYLHSDRDRLCISLHEEEEKKAESTNWREIPIGKIMRLEVTKRDFSNPIAPGRGFSIIANEDADIRYYDFEASSSLDREVLLSTLVVVLEQVHNPMDTKLNNLPNIPSIDDGTLDQPIPCSPSLEGYDDFQLSFGRSRRKAPIAPRPEDCPIIDVEKLDLPYGLSMASYQSNTFEVNNHSVPSKLNASWCDEDVCTLALRDMAYTCTDIFDKKTIKGGQSSSKHIGCNAMTMEQVAMIEEYIATALWAPGAVYSYLTGDVWDINRKQNPTITDTDAGTQDEACISRNRATKLNAQATRLKNLRNEMTFAAALKESQERMRYIQTTQSCDDIDRRGYGRNDSQVAEAVLGRFHSSALIKTVVGGMNSSGDMNCHGEYSEDFYDSDPEDARPIRANRNPRQISLTPSPEMARPRRQRTLSGTGLEKTGSRRKLSKKMNEDVIVRLVQAMNNERMLLMWHPSQTSESPNRSPTCIKLWIESGVYLVDGTFVLPKLTWCSASDDGNGKQLKLTDAGLHKLDLLDICRIRASRRIDRSVHPFADRRNCFEIETQDGCCLFESETGEERDRIVYGLKLVVARLASLLMLRDFRAAEEFFGQISSGVPGEAPAWATGEEGS